MFNIITIIGFIVIGGVSGKLLAQSWYSFIAAFILFFKSIRNSTIKKNLLGFFVLIAQSIFFNLLLFGISYLSNLIDIDKSNLEMTLFWITCGLVFIGSIPFMIIKFKKISLEIYKS